MTAQVSSRAVELENAFQTFNQLSELLIASYQDLENRVSELNKQTIVNNGSPQKQSPHADDTGKLENSANRLTSLLNALPAAVVILDKKGCVQECNSAAVELLGPPLLGEDWCNVIQRAFAPRADDGHNISLRNGRRVNITTNPLGNEPGQILLIKDVTELHALQERLHRSQRLSAMGEMAASLAHQIRTPLSSALLYTSHLKQPDLDADKRLQIVEKITHRMRHMENLVKDMLLFARGGTAGNETISMAGLLQDLHNMIKPLLYQKGEISFQLTDHAPGAMVRGNREVLLSAIQNLVNNAIQSMQSCAKPAHELNVVIKNAGDNVIDILVRDNGPGIPEDIQQRLLEPFFTTRTQGTGLGLAVVDAVARAHGGCLWFESKVGEGSTFVIRLPKQE
jgi:two-component system sensor histidine kinase FlrB